ncbi:serine kinase [Candidatus Aerophobetes bacterium Ae_b3a]|nr:MAG: serine kinase [Candidatus Aerophobetes bacterium Ae_b3a]
MKLKELVEKFDLQIQCASDRLEREIKGGYVSDLLSDVIANGRAGDVWITLQIHQNIVGVASLKDLAAIIIINGRQPEENTIEKAKNEGIPIMVSKTSAFELVGRLYNAGISGTR